MKKETLLAVGAILSADSSCSEEQQKQIIKFCKAIDKPSKRMGTAKEAAGILKCHVKTVHKYATKGLLHPVKITKRKIRYDLNEVTMLLTGGCNNEC
jgi:helix-turn-helix protein